MLKESKINKLQDLIEKINEVDGMVKLHATNPSKFMLSQYEAKKEKLLSYLIDELLNSSIRSAESFRIIMMALLKYYPEFNPSKTGEKNVGAGNDFKALLAGLA